MHLAFGTVIALYVGMKTNIMDQLAMIELEIEGVPTGISDTTWYMQDALTGAIHPIPCKGIRAQLSKFYFEQRVVGQYKNRPVVIF